ncbi:MAG: TIGR03435 family protein [Acidobacteriia bacterium]|nr:TIGR03435 family protein [Terriglobia bacterium]
MSRPLVIVPKMRFLLALLLAAAAAVCQPLPHPTFDVASIRASPPGRFGGNPILGENIQALPGSLVMRHVTLKACIQWAYHVFEYQVSGPDWIGSESYDIAAKAAGPAEEQELRVMLQALLADRFHLTFHRQTKDTRVYVLSVAKGGPKFHESAAGAEAKVEPDQKALRVKVSSVPVSLLIDPLSRIFLTPVVDRTGLAGRYDVAIDVAKYIPQSGEKVDPLSIVQTAVQEDLGLKLEAGKMPLDFLIVDRAEKAPTDN